jgi:hypothetical protein
VVLVSIEAGRSLRVRPRPLGWVINIGLFLFGLPQIGAGVLWLTVGDTLIGVLFLSLGLLLAVLPMAYFARAEVSLADGVLTKVVLFRKTASCPAQLLGSIQWFVYGRYGYRRGYKFQAADGRTIFALSSFWWSHSDVARLAQNLGIVIAGGWAAVLQSRLAMDQASSGPEAGPKLGQGSDELVERFLTMVPSFQGRSAAPETMLPAPANTIRDAILAEAQVQPLQPERAHQLKEALVDLCGFVPDHDAALVERYEADWAGELSPSQREEAESTLARIRTTRAEVITSMRDDLESPMGADVALRGTQTRIGDASSAFRAVADYREGQMSGLLAVYVASIVGVLSGVILGHRSDVKPAHVLLGAALLFLGWYSSAFLAYVGIAARRLGLAEQIRTPLEIVVAVMVPVLTLGVAFQLWAVPSIARLPESQALVSAGLITAAVSAVMLYPPRARRRPPR